MLNLDKNWVEDQMEYMKYLLIINVDLLNKL